jgi:hypothetical protein
MAHISQSEKGKAAPGRFWQKVTTHRTKNPGLCTCTLAKSLIREAMPSPDCCALSPGLYVFPTDRAVFPTSDFSGLRPGLYLYLSLLKEEKKKKKEKSKCTNPRNSTTAYFFIPGFLTLKTINPGIPGMGFIRGFMGLTDKFCFIHGLGRVLPGGLLA